MRLCSFFVTANVVFKSIECPITLMACCLSIYSRVYMANRWSSIDWHNFKGIIIITSCIKLVDLLSCFEILSKPHSAGSWCQTNVLHYWKAGLTYLVHFTVAAGAFRLGIPHRGLLFKDYRSRFDSGYVKEASNLSLVIDLSDISCGFDVGLCFWGEIKAWN